LTGFDKWILWVPLPGHPTVESLVKQYHGEIPLDVRWFEEWSGQGMLHHMSLVVHADVSDPGFQSFTFWDSDMVLSRAMDATEFFAESGKPILPFDEITPEFSKNHPIELNWHRAVQEAIGTYPDIHGMGWLPLTYCRDTLQKTRELIQAHTGKSPEAYIQSCRNEYPQTFAEYNTLSYVAWKHHQHLYKFVPGKRDLAPWGRRSILHFWSHGGLDNPLETFEVPSAKECTRPWVLNGKTYRYPREILADLGFL